MKKKTDNSLNLVSAAIRLLFIISVLNLISCGKNSIYWPANISGFSNFDKTEQDSIIGAINDLNIRSPRPFLSFTNEYPENQKIYFKMIDQDLEKQNGNITVAQAYVQLNKCIIEIFPSAFDSDILKFVIWHELGHCSGLEHSQSSKDIMYWLVKPPSSYDQMSVDRFLLNLSKSLK